MMAPEPWCLYPGCPGVMDYETWDYVPTEEEEKAMARNAIADLLAHADSIRRLPKLCGVRRGVIPCQYVEGYE